MQSGYVAHGCNEASRRNRDFKLGTKPVVCQLPIILKEDEEETLPVALAVHERKLEKGFYDFFSIFYGNSHEDTDIGNS